MSEIFGKDALFSFVNEHYGIEPDYPFSDDASAVLRHPENRKWFALVMRVPKSKFCIKSDNAVDILNLKSDPILIGSLRLKDGFFPAYHMNKEKWITIFLDGTVATVYKGNIIKNLIMDCQSYTKYRPNETTGGIFVSWRRKEELPTGA